MGASVMMTARIPGIMLMPLPSWHAGIRAAAASSSKNAKLFLRRIRLDTFAREQGI
jgi:hypothetical protein